MSTSEQLPTGTDGLRALLEAGVLTLVLDRPERRGALDLPVLEALLRLLRVAGERTEVRCVVLTGPDGSFCAGADLTALPVASTRGPEGGDVLSTGHEVVRALAALPLPVVAAVTGPAAGMGLSLALACDLVLMREDAFLLMAFVRIGLMPDGGATHLLRVAAGRARAGAIALLGERVPAADALAAGLVSEVLSVEGFSARLAVVTRTLAQGPPRALAATKAALHAADTALLHAALDREEQGQRTLLGGAENVEGVTAFVERRPAVFPEP